MVAERLGEQFDLNTKGSGSLHKLDNTMKAKLRKKLLENVLSIVNYDPKNSPPVQYVEEDSTFEDKYVYESFTISFSRRSYTLSHVNLTKGKFGCKLPRIEHATINWPDSLEEGKYTWLRCEDNYVKWPLLPSSKLIECKNGQLSQEYSTLACKQKGFFALLLFL